LRFINTLNNNKGEQDEAVLDHKRRPSTEAVSTYRHWTLVCTTHQHKNHKHYKKVVNQQQRVKNS